MKTLRRHLSYANVVATLALMFAMTGGALAANHYLINSTKQINPKVLKKLKGNAGKTGKLGGAGPQGAIGPQGPKGGEGPKGTEGPKGPEGHAGLSALASLPSGDTESGSYGTGTTGGKAGEIMETAATFPIPLAEGAPAGQVIYTDAATPVTHCSGPGQADKGFVCIYSVFSSGVKNPPIVTSTEKLGVGGTGRVGFRMAWTLEIASNPGNAGTYTVTAG
jgi:hypothetical protein